MSSNIKLSGWYDIKDTIDSIYLQNHPVRYQDAMGYYVISYMLPCDIPDCECKGKDNLPTIILVKLSEEYDPWS